MQLTAGREIFEVSDRQLGIHDAASEITFQLPYKFA